LIQRGPPPPAIFTTRYKTKFNNARVYRIENRLSKLVEVGSNTVKNIKQWQGKENTEIREENKMIVEDIADLKAMVKLMREFVAGGMREKEQIKR